MTAALRSSLLPQEGMARRLRVAVLLHRVMVPVVIACLVALLIAVIVAAGHWVAQATRIEMVRVEGSFGAITQGEIENSLANLVVGRSLLDVPMTDIAAELSGLSWVSAVDVYRVWPHGLIVRVTEKIPVAHWNGDGFISHAGEVFQPENAGSVGALPRLAGPEDKAVQVMAFYSAVNSMLLPLGMSVRELKLNDQLSWEFAVGNGMRLRVDQAEGLSRVRRFLRVYEKRLYEVGDRIDNVDLRYIGGFAVRWAPPLMSASQVSPSKAATGAATPGGKYGSNGQQ